MTAISRGDLVSVIEAAYRLDGDDGTWLARLVDRSARAGLDRGLGACGMFYEFSGDRVKVSSPAARRSAAPTDADTVLTPGGRVEHAGESSDATLDVLKDAAKAMARARGSSRHADPPGAVEAWKALVSGRWTLLDHFDHNGKRYIV